MLKSDEYKNPIAWDTIVAENFDAVFIVGGHNPGMAEMLESELL